jgi:sulfur-oxidizing protein SoxZ
VEPVDMTTIKLRSQKLANDTEIKVLITHPMENGRNRDPISGELIPTHFIQQLMIQHNGQEVLSVEMGGSMSKNPFFSFRLKNLQSGDLIKASWIDNWQQTDSAEHRIE